MATLRAHARLLSEKEKKKEEETIIIRVQTARVDRARNVTAGAPAG